MEELDQFQDLQQRLAALFEPDDSGWVVKYNPKNLTIHLTLACTETCSHCIVAAATGRKETIDREMMLAGIEDAHQNDFGMVGFYGGEPFTRRDLLFEGIERVYECCMLPAVMTNGYWGKHTSQREQIFDRIAEIQGRISQGNDLRTFLPPLHINVSTDEFHPKVTHDDIVQLMAYGIGRKDCNVQIHLSAGDFKRSGREDGISIFEQVAKLTGRTCHYFPGSVFLTEDQLEVPVEGDKYSFLSDLEKKGWIPKDLLADLREDADDGADLFGLCSMLRSMRLPHLCFYKVKDRDQYFVLKGHNSEFKNYDIKLLGAGDQFLANPQMRETVAKSRERERKSRSTENEANLILGLDGRWYVHPAQMHYRISALGDATRDSIARVIERVRAGDEVARILFESDYDAVLEAALMASREDIYGEMTELGNAGLRYEAIIHGLRNPAICRMASNEMVLEVYGDFISAA